MLTYCRLTTLIITIDPTGTDSTGEIKSILISITVWLPIRNFSPYVSSTGFPSRGFDKTDLIRKNLFESRPQAKLFACLNGSISNSG